ncbi:MAG: hypothetical protein D6725_17970 [Planctomycetota bacterium]|nr:MAG: hypothetical protein D6725_17970 [Planctomycetota bacterium]
MAASARSLGLAFLATAALLAAGGCESVVRPTPNMPRARRSAAVGAAPAEESERTGPATTPEEADLRELKSLPKVPAEQVVPELIERQNKEREAAR